MDEIKYLKDTKIEITARKIDNDVYIHQESVVALLKNYKQQFFLQRVSQRSELLKFKEFMIKSGYGNDEIRAITKESIDDFINSNCS